MRKIVLIIIMFFELFKLLVAQDIQVPARITITDNFFSPWATNPLLYEYELKLHGNYYSIQGTTSNENGKKNRSYNKKLGTVDKKLIENILLIIKEQPTKEIKASDFENKFKIDSINTFFLKHAENYWIENDFQKEYIIEQLTNPEMLKNNLELYFNDYDHSGFIDGSSTEVKINFYFSDTILSISSKSILWVGLPIEINGEKNFSPKLAGLIGELIPKSKTERKLQFEGKDLFSAVIRETINNHRKQIDYLESKTYQVDIDSLIKVFVVKNIRVINGTYSTNWNGEKRLSCTLTDSSMLSNISIEYSTTIENLKIKYPVSLIITGYRQLYSLVISSAFFREYLSENKERHLSIVFDDYSCFTDKTKEFALMDCTLPNNLNNFDNAIFISLKNEFGDISRWGLLPNGKYFMWWNNGNPPTSTNDKEYLKCE